MQLFQNRSIAAVLFGIRFQNKFSFGNLNLKRHRVKWLQLDSNPNQLVYKRTLNHLAKLVEIFL